MNDSRHPVRLRDIILVFLKVGAIGFGGGVGMLAIIRQETVAKRRWVEDSELATAVALGQMLPGPFVSNYAEYIGYRLRGVRGMVAAVCALLLPSFLLICLLGFLYFRYGTLPIITRIFNGIQPVVVAILAWATWTIGRANIRNWRTGLIALVAAIALFRRGDVLLVILCCGALEIIFSSFRRTKKPAALSLLPFFFALQPGAAALPELLRTAGELALVFFKVGTVIFGGGFAAIPFLQYEVVDLRHWLTMREFIDAVALGQLTPGPVAIMGAFIGYRVLGIAGALIATIGTFLPSALMLLGLLRILDRIKLTEHPLSRAFLSGVLAAVCGMLLFSTITIARNALTGFIPALIATLGIFLMARFRIEPVWLILAGAAVGVVIT